MTPQDRRPELDPTAAPAHAPDRHGVVGGGPVDAAGATLPELPTPAEAARVWWGIAWNSFGGPAAQIAVMHRELVDERRWISERRFLHALNYCMLLPGPEAQQLATYLGWLMHGWRGGLVAGGLFVLPGFISLLALSLLWTAAHDVAWVSALLGGVKAAVLIVVLEAVQRIGKRALVNPLMVGVAALSFAALFLWQVPFPAVVLAAAAFGWAGDRLLPDRFRAVRLHDPDKAPAMLDALIEQRPPPHLAPSRRGALSALAVFGGAWAGTLLLLRLRGPDDTFFRIAELLSTAAVVTFGGAYAVLGYLAQQAVETYGWLQPGEMLDGLGMAETTPGPLIQVVQFVAFTAAFRFPEGLNPWTAAVLASVLATWVTYLPCFLWIFLGAPFVERLRDIPALTAALSAITAAVLGVVLQLAVWFGLHVLFGTVTRVDGPLGASLLLPDPATLNLRAALIAVAAGFALLRLHRPLVEVIGMAGVTGGVLFLWGGA